VSAAVAFAATEKERKKEMLQEDEYRMNFIQEAKTQFRPGAAGSGGEGGGEGTMSGWRCWLREDLFLLLHQLFFLLVDSARRCAITTSNMVPAA
jgi:hypothetical protein